MANKKKAATTVVAVATAAALLLGGTFAWQSISQTALNEASDVINPGGRLHDDFNGSDKNVYVENFAEDEIFARVRFDEYFEIVMNHGTAAEKTEKITPTATKTDVDTYVTHIFGEENATDEFWNWTMGSADSEPAYYMPTFNLNKDSLAADVNGVFNGANFTITDKDGTQYVDTYVEWTDGAIKEGYEIYDGDTNNVDELSRDYGVLKELTTAVNDIIDTGTGSQYYNADNLVLTDAKEEHTAAQVNAETGFIAMADWDGTSGPFWVYDTDGWCYWAQPIDAGETTGLLMDGIALDEVMDDTWYYAINVVGQFITADDIGEEGNPDNPGFMQDGMTPEAEALLEAIGVDVDGTGGGSDGEGEYETDTLPDIDFVYGEASATVYRGTVYTIGNVASGSIPVNPSAAAITTEDAKSYVTDDLTIVIAKDEPKDTLTLTITHGGDGGDTYTETVTLTVLDSEGGGDDWMPEFTEDPNAAIGGFDKATKFDLDATEYANCLFFSAGTLANEGPDPENITVQIFDKNGTALTLKEREVRVTGTHQVQAYAIAPVPEGTAEGDKFTGIATWTVNGVTYGIAQAYYWVD